MAETSDEARDGARGEPTAGARARAVATAVALGLLGFLLIALWGSVLAGLSGTEDPASAVRQLLAQLATLLGAVTLTGLFLLSSDRDAGFLDLEAPSLRSLGVALAGVAVLLALNLAVEAAGVPLTEHSIEDRLADNPEAALWLMAGGLLFVGPGEELLYRNVVQKVVAERLGAPAAILVASVVFAAAHVFAFAGASTAAVVGTLGLVFVLSVVLGAIYEYTGSLLAVALTHGAYDAVAFASLYWELAG